MKKTRFYIYMASLIIVLLFWFNLKPKSLQTNFSEVVKIALRDVGNQLLLTNNDSTSLILPIKETNHNVFQMAFNSELSILPDDLVDFTKMSLNKSKLPNNYRVEVLQCLDNEVAYSYEMNSNDDDSVIPCMNRGLPESCYLISVKFTTLKESEFNTHWLLLIGFGLLSLIGIEFIRLKQSKTEAEVKSNFETYPLGSFEFYPEQNKLVKAATEISLSKKECELLEIFVSNKNQIIKRDELTKKVWEDNGVM